MVAATGAVGVEVRHIHSVLLQVLTGRAVGLNGAGGGDVVGGHRVAQQSQDSSIRHLRRLIEVAAHGEERRLLDVRGVLPHVGARFRDVDGAPGLGAGKHVRVLTVEHLR